MRRALDFKSRNAFHKSETGAYMFARRHGFLDEACKHMRTLHVAPNYFAKYERCKVEAAKYRSRTEFHLKSCSAYEHALANGWLNTICAHMPARKGAPRNFWNEARVRAQALKFTTRTEFSNKCPGAVAAALKLEIYDEVCAHMTSKQKLPRRGSGRVYWTKEKCRDAALLFKTRTEFQRGEPSAYNRALQDGFLEEICQHMRPAGSMHQRALYAYEFTDNSVYIGLTYNYAERHRQHLTDRRKRLWKKLQTKNFRFVKFQVWMSKNKAAREEQKLVEQYLAGGWKVLNRIKAGGLGGTVRKWFRNTCRKEAQKYQTRAEFSRMANGAYEAAIKNGWLDEVCAHMRRQRVRKWTKELLAAEVRKFSVLSEFRSRSRSAYEAAIKLRCLRELTTHLRRRVAKRKELAPPEDRKPCSLTGPHGAGRNPPRSSPQRLDSGQSKQKPSGFWTFERVKEEALKYASKKEFSKSANGAYDKAKRRKWIDSVCDHMRSSSKPRGYWDNKERVLTTAKKFRSRTEFTKCNGSAYYAAIRNGWLDEACAHMKFGKTPNGTWTKERLIQQARQYATREEFRGAHVGAYHAAHRKGWLEEVCAHMPKRAKRMVRPRLASQ